MIYDADESGTIDDKDRTLISIFKIALNAFSGVMLIGVLIFSLLIGSFVTQPNMNYSFGESDVIVPTFSASSVCFSGLEVDKDVTNDEEFGGVKSPSQYSASLATIGNTSSGEFDGINQDVLSGSVNDAKSTESDDSGFNVNTANSDQLGANVYKTVFSNTAKTPFAIASSKTTSTKDGDLKGIAASKCVIPDTDFWFIGGETHIQNTTKLILANPSNAPAQVFITVWGDNTDTGTSDDGSLKYTANRYIGIEPNSEKSVLLSSGAPDQNVLGVHVEASSTPVAAMIKTQAIQGLTPYGVEFVNPQPMTKSTIIPAFTLNEADQDSEQIEILSPDAKNAIVQVKFINKNPKIGSIQKTYRLNDRKIFSASLSELGAGVWIAEIESSNEIAVTIERKQSFDDGSREISFFNPLNLSDSVFVNVNNANEINLYRAQTGEKDVNIEAISFNSKGIRINTKTINSEQNQLLTFNSEEFEGAEFILFQCKAKLSSDNYNDVDIKDETKNESADSDQAAIDTSKYQQLSASVSWNNDEGVANITGNSLVTRINNFNFRFFPVG